LPKGSMVVNSSQGGGSKDTWVLRAPPEARERVNLNAVARAGRAVIADGGRAQQPLQQHQVQQHQVQQPQGPAC
jgi:hypothetical protein